MIEEFNKYFTYVQKYYDALELNGYLGDGSHEEQFGIYQELWEKADTMLHKVYLTILRLEIEK